MAGVTWKNESGSKQSYPEKDIENKKAGQFSGFPGRLMELELLSMVCL